MIIKQCKHCGEDIRMRTNYWTHLATGLAQCSDKKNLAEPK